MVFEAIYLKNQLLYGQFSRLWVSPMRAVDQYLTSFVITARQI